MEFLQKNQFDTDTSIVVDSATSTAKNLLDRDLRFQYATDGFNNDATTASLTINFGETTSISRIALMGHNLKSFTVFYNGTTANTFSLTSTGATSASDFSSNSETSLMLSATPVDCTSVTIDMKSTQVANNEKAIGYLAVSSVLSDIDGRIPNSASYDPLFTPKEVVHELSDGSFRNQVVDRKFSARLRLDYADTALRNELKNVFDLHDDFMFVAFPTTTGWDEVFFPCIWTGPFTFYEYSDNAAQAGHSGEIRLLETRPS
jgi:hypothetical protein